MMKSIKSVVLLTLTVLFLVYVKPIESQLVNKDVLTKLEFTFKILLAVDLNDVFDILNGTEYYNYKPCENSSDFNHAEKLDKFCQLWQQNPFLDDQVFNVTLDDHEEYAVELVRLLYSAKNWDIFEHAAFWARGNVNRQLFIYAFTIVSMFRDDMKGIVLPIQFESLKPEFLKSFGKNVAIFKSL